ncbi:MAG: PRC-barrel domain-containing protein [Myxococcaceae bacterium]
MRVSDHELRGVPVVAADGIEVGRIRDLIIGTESWTVEALEVKLERDTEEDVGAPHHALLPSIIEIPTRFILSAGDAVTLGIREDQLRELLEEQRARSQAEAELPGYGEGL